MRLPIIKHISNFIENNDEDFVFETIETLEYLSELASLSDSELETIGELISNMYGAIEVQKAINNGTPKKQAFNEFMNRVLNAIDN